MTVLPTPEGAARVERVTLDGSYTISRIVAGGWQLSAGHSESQLTREGATDALLRYADAGVTTFDCADIYTGVEDLFGEFLREYRNRLGTEAPNVQVHAKFVPDLDTLHQIDRRYVESIIDRSLERLGVEQLDLVQFAWWDYRVPRYVETGLWLEDLRAAGKIARLGATNFDVPRLEELASAGIRFVAHQVQYSLLDRRPENGMIDCCRKHGIKLLCYGSLAGGFLSERYVGAPEPEPPLSTRSLTKYSLIVEEFGGWGAYQDLLSALDAVARRRGTTLPSIAIRYVLSRPQVAGVVVGVRNAAHLEANLNGLAVQLDSDDLERIHAVLRQHPGPSGDVFSLERIPGGPHAAIMRYNLNRAGAV